MSYSEIKNKMINGSGVSNLLTGGGITHHKSNHYIDSLERFEKDFAAHEKARRQQQRRRKTIDIDRRRESKIDRQQKRISYINDDFERENDRRERVLNQESLRIRKRANVTSLPYNPINLQYEKSKPGVDLKRKDEDHKIRNLVRAHNIDNHGSGRYNPVNGETRIGIEELVPQDLNNRFSSRLAQHYSAYKIDLPERNSIMTSRRISKHSTSQQNS